MRYIILSLLLAMGFSAHAADNFDSIAKRNFAAQYSDMLRMMEEIGNLEVSMSYLVMDIDSKDTFTHGEGYYLKRGKEYFKSQLYSVTMVQNKEHCLTIDTLNQTILVSKQDSTAKMMGQMDILKHLDKPNVSVRYVPQKDSSIRVYEIRVQETVSVTSLEIVFTSEGFLQAIHTLQSLDKNGRQQRIRNSIFFNNYLLDRRVSTSRFASDEILKIKKGVCSPTSQYANFKVINLSN